MKNSIRALIYYSQVQNLVENDELAKTGYYKGDFEWAKKQLDVLKSATSQLIANDAMELGFMKKYYLITPIVFTLWKLGKKYRELRGDEVN